jgi:DNA-binding MarR family transcriptional regulator
MVSTGVKTDDERVVEVAARLRVAIFRTARRLRQEAGVDLSPAALAALGTIERHGPLTPSELADLEGVRRPTATRMIARLDAEGLIVRTRDPADGRSSLVSVSSGGRALLRRLRKRRTAYLARRLRELQAEEVSVLARAAQILEQVLEGERR